MCLPLCFCMVESIYSLFRHYLQMLKWVIEFSACLTCPVVWAALFFPCRCVSSAGPALSLALSTPTERRRTESPGTADCFLTAWPSTEEPSVAAAPPARLACPHHPVSLSLGYRLAMPVLSPVLLLFLSLPGDTRRTGLLLLLLKTRLSGSYSHLRLWGKGRLLISFAAKVLIPNSEWQQVQWRGRAWARDEGTEGGIEGWLTVWAIRWKAEQILRLDSRDGLPGEIDSGASPA